MALTLIFALGENGENQWPEGWHCAHSPGVPPPSSSSLNLTATFKPSRPQRSGLFLLQVMI